MKDQNWNEGTNSVSLLYVCVCGVDACMFVCACVCMCVRKALALGVFLQSLSTVSTLRQLSHLNKGFASLGILALGMSSPLP